MADLIDDLDFLLRALKKDPKPQKAAKPVPLKEYCRNSVYRILSPEQ